MTGKLFKYCFVVLLMLGTLVSNAQQDPMFTQYMNNPGIINPAYSGSSGNVNLNGIFRKQWLGFDWSPMTTSLSASTPIEKYDLGLGLTLVDDQLGPLHQTGLYIDYAKFFRFAKRRNLALGLKTGFNYIDIDLFNLYMNEPDPHIANNPYRKKFLPNFGVGAFYFTPKFYAGLSVPKLIRNSISDSENTNVVLGREERHYYFTMGYVYTIDDPVWKVKASMMSRLVEGAPPSVELTATVILYERLWFGLAYRFGDAIAIHGRFQVDERFQIGYSYDLNNSRLRKYNSGSHEIFLSYDFSFRGQRILSPRYF
ncbi:MAG TPA: type IX secretion system membrane protein PorP/SprF [Prolixibacteraceae bacterium]|nr:type IX secretion system membrane protein PorP/SprF [Prolixibacteraceae bacterium]